MLTAKPCVNHAIKYPNHPPIKQGKIANSEVDQIILLFWYPLLLKIAKDTWLSLINFLSIIIKIIIPKTKIKIDRVLLITTWIWTNFGKNNNLTAVDSPLLAYDDYLVYYAFQTYKIEYNDVETKKTIQSIINESLKAREKSRGGKS